MKPMSATAPMTAEEFLERPPFPGRRGVQLVGGEVVVNEPNLRHEGLQMGIYNALRDWIGADPVRGRVHVPIDVRLDAANVFAPDVLWYSSARAPQRSSEPPYPLPEVAAEVRSGSTWRYDIGAKKSAYERHGLPELWLVDTAAEELLVFRRSTPVAPAFDTSLALVAGGSLESPLLPGFALDVGELFYID